LIDVIIASEEETEMGFRISASSDRGKKLIQRFQGGAFNFSSQFS